MREENGHKLVKRIGEEIAKIYDALSVERRHKEEA